MAIFRQMRLRKRRPLLKKLRTPVARVASVKELKRSTSEAGQEDQHAKTKTCLTGHAAKNVVSQNGVKYRTLCKDCNEYIGAEYDETLNQFVRSIGRILQVSPTL